MSSIKTFVMSAKRFSINSDYVMMVTLIRKALNINLTELCRSILIASILKIFQTIVAMLFFI